MQSPVSIELLRNARIAPLTALSVGSPQAPGRFDGGVYYQNNVVCQQGLHGKTHYTNKPASINAENLTIISGRHIFGGMLQEHFGHFLTESLGRVWAANYLSPDFKSIALYHRVPGGKVPSFVREIFQLLAPGLQIKIIQQPTVVEELAVPTQVEKHGVVYGHPVMQEAVLPLNKVRGDGAKRVYVSRSGLSLNDGGLLFETWVERHLENEGYWVIRPEKMSIREQFAAYNEAEDIVFAEGSALHLYALVARSSQRVFVIWRRKLATHFGWQIGTFGGSKTIYGMPCIKTLFVPPSGETCARALINFEDLCSQLKEAGFINGKDWIGPTVDEVKNEMSRVQLDTRRLYVTRLF